MLNDEIKKKYQLKTKTKNQVNRVNSLNLRYKS